MRETYRILDANFNRAREALRVAEDCGRFALNDPAVTAMAKNLRSELREVLSAMPFEEMITSRDTPGDIGTEITSPTEAQRENLTEVAIAACKRLTEALRTIEEYCKFVAPDRTVAVERMRYDAYTLEQRLVGRLLVGQKFADVRLYVLISSSQCRGSIRELARQAIAGGADALQVREKGIPDDVVLAVAAELRELTDETGRLLIINDRPDIAAMVGADGVHLGQHDVPIAEARRLLRPGAVVGRSCHTLAQAKAAVNEGADYISVGPIFQTSTKDAGPPVGPELLTQVAAEVKLPIVAVGGINADNVAKVVKAGAKCVAVSSAVCSADAPQAATEEIRKHLG
ncbi:MAG TPA: thiamine phosphate synthase [Phycisphaerae bacterium]|nr:thiamine phosphate synthase [Phycisphaerae bacterium]